MYVFHKENMFSRIPAPLWSIKSELWGCIFRERFSDAFLDRFYDDLGLILGAIFGDIWALNFEVIWKDFWEQKK